MGTGAIVMVTKEAPLEEPLEIERIREGDLLALHQFSTVSTCRSTNASPI